MEKRISFEYKKSRLMAQRLLDSGWGRNMLPGRALMPAATRCPLLFSRAIDADRVTGLAVN